ncbi:aldehyde dehydrogenase [Fusarium acutatum]|uniref:Aldehyde dehydrogenase n=1 Tax=Fusarium acutatum TaxID=78861 RepID=A0A8H4NA43_9HYPO|nr:aldehyde dehydrogenase [Fusarium acutatum]
MAPDLARVRAALIDQRCRAPFYRQTELRSLHDALLSNSKALQDALAADCGYTKDETTWEISASLLCVKREFQNFKPKDELANEYLVANEKDNAQHREPIGLCYIEPATKHTPLFSIISALAPSIAAGNCNVVTVSDKTLLGQTLRSALSRALDQDAFMFIDAPLDDPIVPGRTLRISQSSSEARPHAEELVSLDSAVCIAVVDRTADLKKAAQQLFTARFTHGGRSPYAPDIVLVNEFAMGDFVKEVLREAMSASPRSPGSVGGTTVKDLDLHINSLQKRDSDAQLLMRKENFAVIQRASSNELLLKTQYPLLTLYPFRSLDHAIDLLAQQQSGSPALATYLFANPETAKYLSQFIEGAATFVNHVPTELLLGPAFPHTKPVDLKFRYPRDVLTLPRPQYIHSGRPAAKGGLSSKIAALKIQALAPVVVPYRHSGADLGFFDRGVIISLGFVVTTFVGTVGCAVAYWFKSRAI